MTLNGQDVAALYLQVLELGGKCGYMKYRTVPVFPQVGDKINKAIERIATKQQDCREAMKQAQEEIDRRSEEGRNPDLIQSGDLAFAEMLDLRRLRFVAFEIQRPRSTGGCSGQRSPCCGGDAAAHVFLLLTSFTPLNLTQPETMSTSRRRSPTTACSSRTAGSRPCGPRSSCRSGRCCCSSDRPRARPAAEHPLGLLER